MLSRVRHVKVKPAPPPTFRIQVPNMRGKPHLDLSVMTSHLVRVAAAWNTPTPLLSAYMGSPSPGASFATWVPMSRMPDGAAGYHDTVRNVARMVLGYSSLHDPENIDVAFHEMAEALVDPMGTRFLPGPSIKTGAPCQYLAEVCDPVEDTLYAFVSPDFYAAPRLNPTGYISWIEDNHWRQAFADENGDLSYANLGLAAKRTRAEKESLRTAAGLPG